MPNSYAIIGGGMAGLAAAETLISKDPEATITIYEALNRLGGRAYTETIAGVPMDWGCEALEAGERAPTEVLKEYGRVLETVYPDNDEALGPKFAPTDNETQLFFDTTDSGNTDVSFAVQFADPPELQQMNANIDAVRNNVFWPPPDSLMFNVDLHFPREDFYLQRMKVLSQYQCFSEGAVPGRASLRDLIRSENLQRENDHEESVVYFAEGLGATVMNWADKTVLGNSNVVQKLNTPVKKVENTPAPSGGPPDPGTKRQVAITTNDDETDIYDAVLVTASTNVIASSVLDLPDLPPEDLQAFKDCPLGTYYKIAVENVADIRLPAPNRRIFATYKRYGDLLHIAQSADGNLVLAHASNYLGAQFADGSMDPRIWFKNTLQGLHNGELDFSTAVFHTAPWYVRPEDGGTFGGAYSYCKTGRSDARERLASLNVGQIFFAGEACSPMWYGQLAGAMESGQRMANRMYDSLTD